MSIRLESWWLLECDGDPECKFSPLSFPTKEHAEDLTRWGWYRDGEHTYCQYHNPIAPIGKHEMRREVER